MNRFLSLLAVAITSLLTSCTFHSTATHWNGRTGPNGKPVYVKSATNVGINGAIVVPVLGNTNIDAMVNGLTREIATENGNRVRVIETDTMNYWHGFPPFTWIVTPVVTTVTAEYEPQVQQVPRP